MRVTSADFRACGVARHSGERRQHQPRKPVAEQKIDGALVPRWYIGQQRGERRGVARRSARMPAAAVAHGEVATPCRARDAEAALDATHHRDMAVQEAIEDEIPCRHQQQACVRLAILPRKLGEIHILADGHTPGPGRIRDKREGAAGGKHGLERRKQMVLVVAQNRGARREDSGLVINQRQRGVADADDNCCPRLVGQGLKESVGWKGVGILDLAEMLGQHDDLCAARSEHFSRAA